MKKELGHQESQSTTAASMSGSGVPDKSVSISEKTAQSFLNDWFSDKFDSEGAMFTAIAEMNSWQELDYLRQEVEGYQKDQSARPADKVLYSALLDKIEKAQMYASE